MRIFYLVSCIFGLALELIFASAASPLRHVVANFGSDWIFVMDESKDGIVSSGRCYKIDATGNFQVQWKTEGFYAWPRELLLSTNGKVLVRFKKVRFDTIDGESTFIEVYRDGILIKELPLGLFIDVEKLGPDPFGSEYVNLTVEDPDSLGILDVMDVNNLKLKDFTWNNDDELFISLIMPGEGRRIVSLDSGKLIYKEEAIKDGR